MTPGGGAWGYGTSELFSHSFSGRPLGAREGEGGTGGRTAKTKDRRPAKRDGMHHHQAAS